MKNKEYDPQLKGEDAKAVNAGSEQFEAAQEMTITKIQLRGLYGMKTSMKKAEEIFKESLEASAGLTPPQT